ncbi:MAG: hypothetical protein JW797_15220 [Bradymonadales bacterium]|nr:hypothetical protein [Bradymonadales bacterium]
MPNRIATSLHSAPLLLLGIAALATLIDCQNTSTTSCAVYTNDYNAAVANDGQLSQEIASAEPYPMAIIISQDALNRLFAAVAGEELPPVTLGSEVLGVPLSLTLRPSLPLIQVGGERECTTCLLTELDFGLDVTLDQSTVSGSGAGRYQFPLTLEANGMESTRAMAQLGESTVLQVDFSVSGLSSEALDVVEPLVSQAATYVIRNTLGDTELFELTAWEIGDGDVKLLGFGPLIYPEQETVAIGIHTNLIRPLSGSVSVTPALPEGVDIGMQFHPELVQQMVRRMMFEGHIDRSYDMTGNPTSSGGLQVSLDKLEGSDDELLRSGFTLWRTDGGLCGCIGLQADLGLSISDAELRLEVNDLAVVEAAGIGEYLVAVDQWLSSPFLSGLIDTSEITLNYRQITLPDEKQADLSARSFELALDARGLSIFLNIDAIQ